MTNPGLDSTQRGGKSRTLAIVLGAFVAFRGGLLWGLYAATRGVEFTSDITSLVVLARQPWIFFTSPQAIPQLFVSFPPLSPVVLYFSRLPWTWVGSDFLEMRLAFATLEVPVLVLLLRLARVAYHLNEKSVRRLGIAYVLMPASFFTTVVMCQEEAMAAFFVLACSLMIHRRRWWGAAGVAVLGIFTAKIFLLLLPVVWFLSCPEARLPASTALAAVAAIYVPYSSYVRFRTGQTPVVDFSVARAPFSISLSAVADQLMHVSPWLLRYGSAALVGVSILLLIWRDQGQGGAERTDLHTVVGYVMYTLFFYHVNPEYLLWYWPLWLVVAASWGERRMWRTWGGLYAVSSFAWAFNLFYGVASMRAGEGYSSLSKERAAQILGTITGGAPAERVATGFLVAMWAVLAATTLYSAGRREPLGGPEPPRGAG